MINENQVGEILSRRQRNESISQIARTMNLSRPTVRRYANMPEEQAQQARTHQKLNRCSILDEYRDQIKESSMTQKVIASMSRKYSPNFIQKCSLRYV